MFQSLKRRLKPQKLLLQRVCQYNLINRANLSSIEEARELSSTIPKFPKVVRILYVVMQLLKSSWNVVQYSPPTILCCWKSTIILNEKSSWQLCPKIPNLGRNFDFFDQCNKESRRVETNTTSKRRQISLRFEGLFFHLLYRKLEGSLASRIEGDSKVLTACYQYFATYANH